MAQKLPSLSSVLAQKNGQKPGGLPSLDSVVSKNGTKGLPSLSDVLNHKNAAKAPAPKQHHGSLVGNLVHDAETAAANIVPGTVAIAEHPVRAAKQIGHQYGAMYGPLVHGDFGKFYANVHAHPLQPLLDAATVATLGAGLAAKAGVLSSEAADLTVPNIAKQAGQGGEDVLIRKSSTNPVTRVREVAVNKALNKARPDIPVVGSQARFARTIAGRSLKEGQALALKGNAFKQAFGRLSNAERAAWHLKARQLDPAAYTKLLESGAVKDPASTEVAMMRRLQDKSLNEVYRNPTKKLNDALTKGRALADLMTAEKVQRGYVEDVAAAERPYLAQRLVHGAQVVSDAEEAASKPSPGLVAATAYRDRVARLVGLAEHQVAKQRFTRDQLNKIGGVAVDPGAETRMQSRLDELNKQINQLRTKPVRNEQTKAVIAERRGLGQLNRLRANLEGLTGEYAGLIKEQGIGGSLSSLPGAEELQARIDALTQQLEELGGRQRRPNVPSDIAEEVASLRKELKALRASAQSFQMGERIVTHKGAVLAPAGYARLERLRAALSVANDRVNQLAASNTLRLQKKGISAGRKRGIYDLPGREIPSLAAELARRNEMQPFYVKDSAEAGKLPRQSWKPEATAPMALKSQKENQGVLLRKGMLNLHHDSLGMEMDRFARHVQRTDVHGALMEHAAKVPETGLPEGWRILKTTTGQRSAPYTERAAGDLKRALAEPEAKDSLLERFTSKNVNDPEAAVDGEGHKIMVPDRVAELLAHQAAPTKGLIRKILFNKPTSVWKHLVLGLRPAYFANIVLSQHILGALQMAGGTRGVAAYLNHLVPGARLGKLTDATVEDVLPEQAHGTFSGTEGATPNKGLAVAARAYQGVMPATLAVENWLRRLMIEGWAKSEPEVRAALARNGGDINLALREVAKTDPHVLEEISRRVDHAQGNYRTYNATEQKLRQIIPFYGWDRHIVQSTYRLLAERPALANAGYQTGELGNAKTIRDLGDLPTYLQGIVKLSGLPGFMGPLAGRTPALSTKAVGPFAADADILRTAESLVHGRAGTSPEEANNINPLLAAVVEQLTGRNIATGATLKDTLPGGYLNVPVRAALNVPQARLIEQLIGQHPLGQSKHPTSSPDWQSQLAAILGVPVKKLDLNAAHNVARKQGQPPR